MPAPAAPTRLAITSHTDVKVSLIWDLVSGVTYNVYKATVAGGPYTLVTSGLTTNTYDVLSLTPNTTYYFVVSAVGGGLESVMSNEVSAFMSNPPNPPTVTNYSNLTATSITLSWDASLNTDTYTIYQDTVINSYGVPVVTGIVGTSYNLTGLTPNTQYCFSIASVNKGGESALNSPFLNVTTPASGAPAVPAQVTGLTVGTVTDTAVNLSWTAPSGASTYNVYKASATGGPYTLVVSGVTGTTYQVTGLTASTKYYLAVSASNTTGEGIKSAEVSPTTLAPKPTAPTGLTVGAVTDTTVPLSWTGVSGATSYSVYKASATGGPYTLVTSGLAGTSYTVTGLTASTKYYFVVSASNATGESPMSAEVSPTTAAPLPLPVAPTGLTPTVVSASRIDVGWNAVANATSYNMYRATVAGGPYTLIASGVTALTYQHTGLTFNTRYYFTVSAVNASGEGVKSTEVNAITPYAAIPNKPTGVRTVAMAEMIEVDWTDNADSATHNVYQATSSSGPWTKNNTTGTWIQAPGLNSDTLYFFYVTGVNPLGESVQSDMVSTKPLPKAASTAVPPAPTGLTVGAITDTSVALSWSKNYDAQSYSVYKATVSGGPYQLVVSGVTDLAYTVKGLTAATPYYFVISGVNNIGESPKSAQVTATTGASTAPTTAPTAPTGVSIYSVYQTQVSVAWNAVAGADRYNVYMATVSGGPYTLVDRGLINGGLMSTITNLTTGTRYYFTVTAVNNIGESVKSLEISVITLAPPAAPTTPVGILVKGITADSVTLAWSQVPEATFYRVYRSATTGGPWTEILVDIKEFSYTVSSLLNGTNYFFTVAAFNSTGSSARSAEVSARTDSPPMGDDLNPILIYTIADLLAIRTNAKVPANYKLMADLDLNVAPHNTGVGWVPLTDSGGVSFKGNFNGNGFSIKNIYIRKTASDSYSGLFSKIECIDDGKRTGTSGKFIPSIIKNLNLPTANIVSGSFVGALAGSTFSTVIYNCSADGAVSGASYDTVNYAGSVGGLVGFYDNAAYAMNTCRIEASRYNGSVVGGLGVGGLVGIFGHAITSQGVDVSLIDSYSTGTVQSNVGLLGGLVGVMEFTPLFKRCYSTSNVSITTPTFAIADLKSRAVGGLVGKMDFHSRMSECYASGSVTAPDNTYVGGLVGHYTNGEIFGNSGSLKDCYATGAVKGKDSVGGLFGYYDELGTTGMFNCHSVGSVVGVTKVGGEIGEVAHGYTGQWIYNCYYDTTKSGQADTGKGAPKVTADMGTQATFVNWDFTSVWKMNATNSYPVLIWSTLLSTDPKTAKYYETLFVETTLGTKAVVLIDTDISNTGIVITTTKGDKYVLTVDPK